MAKVGNLTIAGSARVVAAQDAFVADSNNGAFTGITDNGAGDSTLDLDPDFPPIAGGLSAGDTVDAQSESATNANCVVERVSATQIRVRSFVAGVATDVAYSINITKRQVG